MFILQLPKLPGVATVTNDIVVTWFASSDFPMLLPHVVVYGNGGFDLTWEALYHVIKVTIAELLVDELKGGVYALTVITTGARGGSKTRTADLPESRAEMLELLQALLVDAEEGFKK